MGMQSNYIEDIFSITADSTLFLQDFARNDYYAKYFLFGNCKDKDMESLKHHYILKKYVNPDNCTIAKYVDKKVSGELDFEYRRRKILQTINRVEFQWECNDLYNPEEDCCNWKSIEW